MATTSTGPGTSDVESAAAANAAATAAFAGLLSSTPSSISRSQSQSSSNGVVGGGIGGVVSAPSALFSGMVIGGNNGGGSVSSVVTAGGGVGSVGINLGGSSQVQQQHQHQQQQQQQQHPHQQSQPMDGVLPLVVQLTNPEQREGVLLELSKKRESFPDLAPILWHTYGTVAALLQEIASIYPLLNPPTLTAHASNRVCNALALLQCVASHPDTRSLFLSAHVPLYLYPFLNTQSKSRPFEYLRLTSLGVIGALVKMDDADVINFLLQTEIIPLCLRIMETGSELSKTVATFIVQKILLDEIGLSYVCATPERFYAVSAVLNSMVGLLGMLERPSVRLLKHIVRCYLRLADNARAGEALGRCLPEALKDGTFGAALRDDVTVRKWLGQLLTAVANAGGAGGNGAPSGGAGGHGSNGGNGNNVGGSGAPGGDGGVSLVGGMSGMGGIGGGSSSGIVPVVPGSSTTGTGNGGGGNLNSNSGNSLSG